MKNKRYVPSVLEGTVSFWEKESKRMHAETKKYAVKHECMQKQKNTLDETEKAQYAIYNVRYAGQP